MYRFIKLTVCTCSQCAYLQIRTDVLGYCLIHHCPVPLRAGQCKAFRLPLLGLSDSED